MRPAPAERQECHQVLVAEGWHQVKVFKSKSVPVNAFYDMLVWCDDTLGYGRVEPSKSNWLDGEDVWYSFTWFGYHTFYFKHETDATAFALRWV